MTEEQLDSLRFKLGGDWYDTWWLTIDERFDPMPLGFDEPTFFDLINKGWLEMYGESNCILNHFHNCCHSTPCTGSFFYDSL
tara:strand:+ start:169 stop:414 length:246 start_codon:yes stop_codon:yes gene_type:complete